MKAKDDYSRPRRASTAEIAIRALILSEATDPMRGIEFKKLMRRTSLLPPGLGVVFSPIPWVDELRLRPVGGVLASRIAPIEGFSAKL